MENRGLLTKGDRKAFRGEREVSSDRLVDIRHNVRKRMERMERDLEILESAGEEELVDNFYSRFSVSNRLRQVERELERMKSKKDGE